MKIVTQKENNMEEQQKSAKPAELREFDKWKNKLKNSSENLHRSIDELYSFLAPILSADLETKEEEVPSKEEVAPPLPTLIRSTNRSIFTAHQRIQSLLKKIVL